MQIGRVAVLERLTPLLEDSLVRKVGHDLKFDLIVLANHGITLRGVEFDSMLGSYLLDATAWSSHRRRRARAARLSCADRGGRVRQGTRAQPMARLSPDTVLNFSGERADLAWQLSRALPR